FPLVITEGAHTLVIERRRANLLTEAGQLDVRQALDRFLKLIHARLGKQVEAPIRPLLVQFEEGARLRIAAELALKEVVDEFRVALVADGPPQTEIRANLIEIAEP